MPMTKWPKSGAQRQAAYRARQADTGKVSRVSFDLPIKAKRQLEKLARHLGDTQRDVLVGLIEAAGQSSGQLHRHDRGALERLARHYGVSRRVMLQRLIGEADIAVSERLTGDEVERYVGKA